jgi:U3 small nucleolar RNA-associated protein 12
MPPKLKDKNFVPESVRNCGVELPGHRTDVRALSVSSDDALLASASNGLLLICEMCVFLSDVLIGQVKIWNLKTLACIRTMECGYALSCAFLPRDKHVSDVSSTTSAPF